MSTPYIGYSNETLDKLKKVSVNDLIECPNCNGKHKLEAAANGSETLMFYSCGDTHYLGAVDRRCIIGVKCDVSGEVP